jgi:hypothetical protein
MEHPGPARKLLVHLVGFITKKCYDARSHERKKLWIYLLIYVSWVHIFKSWYESRSVWLTYFRNFARKLKRYFVYKVTFPALIKRHKNANGKKLNNVQQNYVMAKSRQET